MKYKEFIGIDVSKSVIDVVIYSNKLHCKFRNDEQGFANLIEWLKKHLDCGLEEVLFAFEHTGLYSLWLSLFLDERKYNFTMISGLAIKRSMGLVRCMLQDKFTIPCSKFGTNRIVAFMTSNDRLI